MVTKNDIDLIKRIQELYRSGASLQKFKKLRSMIFEWAKDKIQGLESDDNFEYLYFLNQKVFDLVKLSNEFLLEMKNRTPKELINKLNEELIYILKQRKMNIMNNYNSVIREIVQTKTNIKNKIKIIKEGNELFLFFEDGDCLKEIENALINCLQSSIGFANPKKIESIGMIKGTIDNSESLDNVIRCIESVKNQSNLDFTYISPTEILIFLDNNKDLVKNA